MSRPVDQHLATRRDAVPLRMGATPVETRPDGSKVYEGTAAFGDVVAPYPDLVPPRSEFRPAEEVMSPEALKSLEGLRFTGGLRARDWDGKVTLPGDHTPDLDDPDGEAIEGVVLRGWRVDEPGEPPALRVRVIAHTRAMQDLLEGGTRGLSLGYVAEEDRTPGVHGGKPYQVIQRRHRYYHLAAVRDPRSKTPSGRGARLDSCPSYPPPAKDTHAPMKRKPTDLSPLAVLALASLTGQQAPTGARFDAVAISPADAELIKQLSPDLQAAVAAAMGGAEAVAAGEDLEADGDALESAGDDEAAELEGDVAQDAAMLAPVLAKVAAIEAALAAAGIKVGEAANDAMPPSPDAAPKMDAAAITALDAAMVAAGASAEVAKQGVANFIKALNKTSRQDSAVPTPTNKTPSAIDPADIIAAVAKRFDADAEFTSVVRRDGHPANTVAEAATSMLAVINANLPMLSDTATEHVKNRRLDSLVPLYKQAEDIRRKAIMDSQERSTRVVMDAQAFGGVGLSDLPAGDGITRAPMRS